MHFGCTEVTRANFSVRTVQPSAALIQNVIRESAESAAPSLCETSANSLKLSARNAGPVTLIPENSAESRDAFDSIEKPPLTASATNSSLATPYSKIP